MAQNERRIINVKGLSHELLEELVDIILQRSSINFSRSLLKEFIISQKMFGPKLLLLIDLSGDVMGGVVVDKTADHAYAWQYLWVVDKDNQQKAAFLKQLFEGFQQNFFFVNAVYWESSLQELDFYKDFLQSYLYGQYVVDQNRVFWTAYTPSVAGRPKQGEAFDENKKFSTIEAYLEKFSYETYFRNTLLQENLFKNIAEQQIKEFVEYWSLVQQTLWDERKEEFDPLDIQKKEYGFYFIGLGTHFHRAIATWAGWIDEQRPDQRWRYDIKQTQYRTASSKERSFINRAGKVADYLGENITQHASSLGGVGVIYDSKTGGGVVVAMDKGNEGFPMDVELTEGGFIKQKSSHHGDGIAMKYIKELGGMTIISKGKYVNISRGEKRAIKSDVHSYQGPMADDVQQLKGTMIIVHIPGDGAFAEDDKNTILKEVGGIDLNPHQIQWIDPKETSLEISLDVNFLREQLLSAKGLVPFIVSIQPVDQPQTMF